MQDCKKCGIFDVTKEACWRFSVAQKDCAYFTPIQYDGAERLEPKEHWDFKIADMKARSMRGPV